MPTNENLHCLIQNTNYTTWTKILASGCKEAYSVLSSSISGPTWKELLNTYHFLEVPDFPLTQAELQPFVAEGTPYKLSLSDLPLITPLQMAVAASSFSTEGTMAAPVLSYAVETPHQGWVILPHNEATTIERLSTLDSNDFITPEKQNFWVFIGSGERNEGPVIWYVSGTSQYWNRLPLMVVVLLEENSPATASDIGENLLFHALQLK
jgi:hypothetical protein